MSTTKFVKKMTQAQEKMVPVYRDKWLKNGRKTTRLNKKKATAAIKTIYKCAGMEPPKHFFFFPSPIQCQLAVNVLKSDQFQKELTKAGKNFDLWSNLRSNLESNLRSNLGGNLGSNLWSNLWSNLGSNLESNLESNLGSNLRSNLGSNLWSNLWSNLRSNLESNLGSNLGGNLWSNLGSLKLEYENVFWGNHWVGWVGFYDFILNELFEEKIKEYKSFLDYIEALQQIHLFIPYKDIVFISDNPTDLHLNAEGRLHADQNPAMMYGDGYSLFYLNGIKVPKGTIEAKPDDITKDMIVKETNADVRREVIRKIGGERLLKVLDYKVLDKMDEYELISFEIGDGRTRPFLKMTCPSTKLTHVEGVRPEINTVKAGLAYKFKVETWKRPLAEA